MKLPHYLTVLAGLALTYSLGYLQGYDHGNQAVIIKAELTSPASSSSTESETWPGKNADYPSATPVEVDDYKSPYILHAGDYESFKKLLAFYCVQAEKEKHSVEKQLSGYNQRLGNQDSKSLPAADVAMEENHVRLYHISFWLKDTYESLSKVQQDQAEKDFAPIPFHMGLGENDPFGFYNPKGRGAFRMSVLTTFPEVDYMSSFSVSDDRKVELGREVDEAIKKL
jgi:hypothetical protein